MNRKRVEAVEVSPEMLRALFARDSRAVRLAEFWRGLFQIGVGAGSLVVCLWFGLFLLVSRGLV